MCADVCYIFVQDSIKAIPIKFGHKQIRARELSEWQTFYGSHFANIENIIPFMLRVVVSKVSYE